MPGVFDPTRRRQLAPSHIKLDSAAVAAFAINEQFKADAEARAEQVARAKGDDCDDPMDAGPKMDAEPQVRKLPSGMWEVSIGGRIFNVMSSVKTEAEAVANAKEYLRHIEAGERRGSHKSDAEFTEKETREAEKTPKERREDVPEKAFLDPPDKYPVMTKQGGDWKYSKDMLEAAESRAAQQGRRDLANRAKEILVREFGNGKADADSGKKEFHVQMKAKHNGSEVTTAYNVQAATNSEAESKARDKCKANGDEFVRILSVRAGPHGVSGS